MFESGLLLIAVVSTAMPSESGTREESTEEVRGSLVPSPSSQRNELNELIASRPSLTAAGYVLGAAGIVTLLGLPLFALVIGAREAGVWFFLAGAALAGSGALVLGRF